MAFIGWLSGFLLTVVATEQTTRLRITNGCQNEAMWIAHMAAASIGPDPQNVKIEPQASYDFLVPAGLTGTRYWPKLGCDALGNGCSIGESGGPGQNCDPTEGCAPPVDSKFEATFGQNGEDWLDISLVDGFTLPFKMQMFLQEGKKCDAGDGDRAVLTTVDCSTLSLDACPHDENMGIAAPNADLKVLHPHRNQTVGCYSPCSKLTFRQWGNALASRRSPWDPEVKDYCCPTPPESPAACRAGPVKSTEYVRAVHEGCPGVYGYAYDDGMGLLKCPDDTRYHVTFYCPAQTSAQPVVPEDPAQSSVQPVVVPEVPAAQPVVVPEIATLPVQPFVVPEFPALPEVIIVRDSRLLVEAVPPQQHEAMHGECLGAALAIVSVMAVVAVRRRRSHAGSADENDEDAEPLEVSAALLADSSLAGALVEV